MAMIIGFFRALFQLRDRRFRRVLLRSVVYSAALLVGFGICTGWLVTLLPDAVALPLIGEVTVPLIGTVTVPVVGEIAVPLRQVEIINLPLLIMISSLLMFPAAGAVVNLMLDEIVDAVEARYYADLPELSPSGWIETFGGAAAFSLVVLTVNLGALVFYVVAGALAPLVFWGVNGFLIGREFFTLVVGRRMPREEVVALRRTHAWRIWLAGCLMAVPLSLPLIGFIMPVLGAAMHTHMFHRFSRPQPSSSQEAGHETDSEVSDASTEASDHARASVEALTENMAHRIRRLKARQRLKHPQTPRGPQIDANHAGEERLVALACLLRGLSVASLRELAESQGTEGERRAHSDVERLALALASGERSAAEALLKVSGSAQARKAAATDEILARAYEEWQHFQAAKSAEALSTGAKYLEQVPGSCEGDGFRPAQQGELTSVPLR